MRKISVILFCIWTNGSGGYTFLRYFLSRAMVAILFGGAEPLWAILAGSIIRSTFLRFFFEFGQVVQEMFKMFLFQNSGSHLVRGSGICWAILANGIMRNMSVKKF